MSHDRGCSCGKEPYEYDDCREADCHKWDRKKAWKNRLNTITEIKMPGDLNAITDADVSTFASFVKEGTTLTVGSNTLDEYQRIATKTAIYPGSGSPLGLMYVALKGAGEAGEFAEHVGKAMRDDGLGNGLYYDGGVIQEGGVPLTPERRLALIKEVGDQLWYLAAKCNELGIRLSEAAQINLEKLNDRTKRNVLSGSGDNR